MRMPCGGRLRRAREGIEWLRAIGVSTVPRGPKGRRTATGMPTSGSRHPKTGNPAPFQISPAPYMLMNLGQRDEPPIVFVVQDGLSRPRLYRPARPRVLHTRPPRSIPHNEPIALRQLQRRHPHQPPRYQSGALLLHELCRRVQPRGCITDLTPEDVGVFGESFLQGADAQLPPERRP